LRMSSLEDYEHISQIIRSPYLVAAESERANRDRLDLLLRRKLPRTTSLASCLKVEGFVESCPILWEILNRFLQLQWPKNASVSAWQRYYLNALAVLGWPGERTLNSAEYQTVTCFYNELTKIEKYQILFESYSCATLLHHLERQLTHCLFQPESPSQVNVQILGVLEISAMQFDEIWVCGLNEEHWPKPANPSPFLPISLQRSLNMPHASAERELHFAKEILSDIQKQCQNLYLSHPVWQEDIHLLPSPLLQQFASETVNLPVWHETDELQKSQLESFEDEYGPALSPDELIDISGGYKFFQDQALCPFKAFAMRRMNVEPFPSFTEQYDHATRGTILHKILENLWQQLKDHSHLLSLSDEQREHIVSNTVLGVLQAWAQRSESLLTRGLAELEQVRLEDLLNEWLKIEVARAPFKVLAQEQTLVTEFAGIPLKIRADRIDQLADGSKIVIDYKSGLVSCKDWADERPKDPQLPLYAILLKAKGIAYAQVRNGNMGIFGISADEPYADGIVNVADNKWCKASDWQELLSIWQKVLSQLAEHFKQGFAKVDPISYEAACRNCGLQSLCRIYESSTLIDVESQ